MEGLKEQAEKLKDIKDKPKVDSVKKKKKIKDEEAGFESADELEPEPEPEIQP